MSGGKKQTYAHKYYAGWQAVLAHAGCFLRRIWVEDKEAWKQLKEDVKEQMKAD